jgi:hypothetical protein
MFLHVLHSHYNTTTLFLVPLNERESRGTVTNGCYCTVPLATVVSRGTVTDGRYCTFVSLLSAESHLPPATQIPTTTVYGKTPVQKLLLFRYASPQNLNLRNCHLATSSTYNSTGITSHVLTTLEHVAYSIIVICHHVATAVAGPNLQVGAVSAFRPHYHYQWDEGLYAQSHNSLISRKQACKIQSNLD